MARRALSRVLATKTANEERQEEERTAGGGGRGGGRVEWADRKGHGQLGNRVRTLFPMRKKIISPVPLRPFLPY
jgi:hypothetical protein